MVGEVILHNLAVKGDALDGLGLPIKVRRGQLRSLRLRVYVKIPWRSLGTYQTSRHSNQWLRRYLGNTTKQISKRRSRSTKNSSY